MERQYYLILCRSWPDRELLTLADLARQACVHPDLVERMVELGIIEPEEYNPQMLFRPEMVADVCRACRLRNDLGINWSGVGLVMDLLERIVQLEEQLSRLR